MSYHIKDLLIESEIENNDTPKFIIDDDEKVLKNLSKVNIFVGANNNGKSIFLRHLAKIKEYSFFLNNKKLHDDYKVIEENFLKIIRSYIKNYFKTDLEIKYEFEVKKNLNIAKLHISKELNNSALSYLIKIIQLDENILNPSGNSIVKDRINSINNKINSNFNLFEDFITKNKIKTKISLKKIYIPTLRGLRNPLIKGFSEDLKKSKIQDLNKVEDLIEEYSNLYKVRTEIDYFNPDKSRTLSGLTSSYKNSNVEIFTGLNLYEEVKKLLLGNFSQRTEVRNFELFLSRNFFDNQEISLIPEYHSDVLHIKIGDEKERPVYELGDGIQSIIAMTFPLFKYPKDNLLVFIEEPELFIHAGLQKTLIKTFLSSEHFENCQFFLVSHSNHIIDAINESDEISIYSVKKELDPEDKSSEKLPKFKIENLGHGNRNALTLLGVTSSSVYLSNCTIWVEGITDKLYLSKYIEVYLNSNDIEEKFKNCINFKEGLHYSFVYSAGDSIIHYEFGEDNEEEDKILVENLCSKAMVIVDNDNNKNTTRKTKLREILGDDNFIELPVIEIENLLSLDVIKKTIKDYSTCSKIRDDEFKVIEDKLRKKIRLGTLIEKHILKDINLPNRKKFSVTSNKKKKITKNENLTINDKVDFCKKSLSHITYENLTIEAKKTVEKILTFIKRNNPDLK